MAAHLGRLLEFLPEESEMLDRDRRMRHEAEVRQTIWEREDRRDARQAKDAADKLKILKDRHLRELVIFGGLIALATVLSGIIGGLASRGVDLWPL